MHFFPYLQTILTEKANVLQIKVDKKSVVCLHSKFLHQRKKRKKKKKTASICILL